MPVLIVALSIGFMWGDYAARKSAPAPATPVATARIWPGSAPGALGDAPGDHPAIAIYLPPAGRATGTGVVICPGGAYKMLMSSYEGEDIAKWLNSFGVAGFVLNYRRAPRYHDPAPRQDVLQAIRYVRAHRQEFGLAADRIGVMGFSAGGHLAATAATLFEGPAAGSADPYAQISDRPDFALLGYAIITLFPPYTHEPSVQHLLGTLHPSDEDRRRLSADLNVTPNTPPVFMFHTVEDAGVPVENSVLFFQALRKNNVPVEMHLYEKGIHGAGLANGVGRAADLPVLATWPMLARNWMCGRGLLPNQPCGVPIPF